LEPKATNTNQHPNAHLQEKAVYEDDGYWLQFPSLSFVKSSSEDISTLIPFHQGNIAPRK
jgi:hypothetical protein